MPQLPRLSSSQYNFLTSHLTSLIICDTYVSQLHTNVGSSLTSLSVTIFDL